MLRNYQWLVVGAALLYAVHDTLLRAALVAGAGSASIAAAVSLASGTLTLLLAWRHRTSVPFWPPLLVGLMVALAVWLQLSGMRHVPIAIATFILYTSPVMVMGLSIWRGQLRPSFSALLVAVLAVGGVALFLPTDGTTASWPYWAMALVFGATILHALRFYTTPLLMRGYHPLYFVALMALSAGALLIIPASFEGWLIPADTWPILAAVVVINIIANMMLFSAQPHLPPTMVTILLTTQTIFATLAGYGLLGEMLSWSALLGGGLIVLSIIVSQTLRHKNFNA